MIKATQLWDNNKTATTHPKSNATANWQEQQLHNLKQFYAVFSGDAAEFQKIFDSILWLRKCQRRRLKRFVLAQSWCDRIELFQRKTPWPQSKWSENYLVTELLSSSSYPVESRFEQFQLQCNRGPGEDSLLLTIRTDMKRIPCTALKQIMDWEHVILMRSNAKYGDVCGLWLLAIFRVRAHFEIEQ